MKRIWYLAIGVGVLSSIVILNWVSEHTLSFTLPISVVTDAKSFRVEYPNGDYLRCYSANINEDTFREVVAEWLPEKDKSVIPSDVEMHCPDAWQAFKTSTRVLYKSRKTTYQAGAYALWDSGRLWYLHHST